MHRFRLRSLRTSTGQLGINMVDLMMWLVIAALLLAAAIQGIGYYQKAALLHTLKSDAQGAGTNTMSLASNSGAIDLATVQQGVTETKWSAQVASLAQEADVSGDPYIRVTHPQLADLDVVYLFNPCGDEYSAGVNVVPKDSNVILEACGISASPEVGGGQVFDPESPVMVSVWDTSLPGCSTIILPVNGTVSGTVAWGDGSSGPLTTTSRTHTYSDTPGPKTVTITGTFTGWGAPVSWTPTCITSVGDWGKTGTTSLAGAFAGAANLTSVPQIPSGVTSLASTFLNATTFNGDVSKWDTSSVTDMGHTFFNAKAFNQPLASWDTSNVTMMNGTFQTATSFNQPIGNWNTSKVENMGAIFMYAKVFDQPIGNWDTSNVKYLYSSFRETKAFNQDLPWDTSNVEQMDSTFENAGAFNGDISGWNTSKVTTMHRMFHWADDFNSNIAYNSTTGAWNVSNVDTMEMMFYHTGSFNQPIGNWNTSKATKMRMMFSLASEFNQNISGWDVAKVTDSFGFYSASALTSDNVPAAFR